MNGNTLSLEFRQRELHSYEEVLENHDWRATRAHRGRWRCGLSRASQHSPLPAGPPALRQEGYSDDQSD